MKPVWRRAWAKVICPSGVPAQVGVSYECRFTGPDGKYVATVRILAVQGANVDENVTSRRVSP